MDGVVVKVVEDDSVERKLEKVASKLSKKYSKQRNINKRLLKKRPLFVRILSKIINIVCTIIFVVAIFYSGVSIFNKINNMPSSFVGFYSMQVVSPSMTKSGFNIGDHVIVRPVDAKTLKQGDIIAFYQEETLRVASTKFPKIEPDPNVEKKFVNSFFGFFGILPDAAKNAANNNVKLVFHHIRAVYKGDDGLLYFSTYGSSNASDDQFLISENLIVGSYDNSNLAKCALFVLTKLSSPWGMFVLLLIPVILIMSSLIINALVNVQYAFLESDVVEEKRKLTDEICVKNNIGYRMNTKTKYKVLAQAPEDQKLEYINLLWKTDNRPENIRKYYLRKDIILRPMQKLRDVNRNCEQMFKSGENPTKIAKYYTQEKEKIQAEQKRFRALVKKIGENNKKARKAESETIPATDATAKPVATNPANIKTLNKKNLASSNEQNSGVKKEVVKQPTAIKQTKTKSTAAQQKEVVKEKSASSASKTKTTKEKQTNAKQTKNKTSKK